jgi:hypothetical protein
MKFQGNQGKKGKIIFGEANYQDEEFYPLGVSNDQQK